MALHELESASAVNTFKSSNPNVLICFSATWCGPCKASKPQLQDLASTYQQDPTANVQFGIVYEHNLAEAIHSFGIKAFPTYVLYINNGSKEAGKIEGVNFEGIKKLITENGCKQEMGEGYSLGGSGDMKTLSAAEARAQRLAMFEKKSPEVQSTSDQMDMDEKLNENIPMETEPKAVDTTTAESDEKDDVSMKDQTENSAASTEKATDKVEMVDPTLNLSKEHLDTLTGAMGFSLLRAQKGLLNGSGSVEGAVEWLLNHQDDANIDDSIPHEPKNGGAIVVSYKCNECGRIFKNMADLELHAMKTGHSDFEESTQTIKPLSEEEKIAKIAEIKSLLKAKRLQREEEEKVDQVEREKQRRSMGQQMGKTREEMAQQAMAREAKQRKKEKDSFKRERARIKAEIEKDKAERRAHKGKLTSKLGIGGYNPDAIQYDVKGDEEDKTDAPVKKKVKASVAKIDEYISKVSAYRAGGDGGKCLKILLAYIKNAVDNPGEDKFKHINMENKAFKGKVKPFIGAKSLLLAVGFSPNKTGTGMDLSDDADFEVLAQTKEKLESACAAY